MTNNLAKIRAALEIADRKTDVFDEAKAALAELETAAREPVAWVWNDELGIPHASAGSKKPVWLESSASAEYIKQANLRPLYAAPPAPVSEIREVEVTDEMAERAYISKWRGVPELIDHEPDDEDRQWAREWLSAWRAELGPTLGLVEIREPTPEECERISMAYYDDETLVDRDHYYLGKDMFASVRAVMWPKSEVQS